MSSDYHKYKEYHRQYYRDNIEACRNYARVRKAKCKAIIAKYRSRPCADCHQQYPPCMMQFDHVRGGKVGKRTVGTMANTSSPIALQLEIDKCEIVCANCHALRTHVRGENRRGGNFGIKDATRIVEFCNGGM